MKKQVNRYEARWLNAINVFNKLNDCIERGYLVVTNENEIITKKFIITDNSIIYPASETEHHLWFVNDPNQDKGLLTEINIYNEKFKGWRVVPKKLILKFKIPSTSKTLIQKERSWIRKDKLARMQKENLEKLNGTKSMADK